ncbi:Hypothetical protein Minf_0103 [Methylacidiphilum infernorum V4]|uniref:Uncharacterized protein n=1 Tax=Methylacidiphilum infernorum (isolate V4) TaxID=481448 RepID=B3DX23_METI4|nr:Hypothetical protein Minf_0103 [Methylacidiphilum infernorum V4]
MIRAPVVLLLKKIYLKLYAVLSVENKRANRLCINFLIIISKRIKLKNFSILPMPSGLW